MITIEKRVQIEKDLREGLSHVEIATLNSVSLSTVKKIKNQIEKRETNTGLDLVKIPNPMKTTSNAEITIKVADFSIEVKEGFNLDLLSDVLKVIRNV